MTRLRLLHQELGACHKCRKMKGPVVHGPAIKSPVLLIGQAPGPREGKLGRPFAWTAGKTLFQWLARATGADEKRIRKRVYFAAIARCFPGKAKGGGDRRPDAKEIERCKPFLAAEVDILRPKLILAIGTLAIDQVLGGKHHMLEDVVGHVVKARYHDHDVDVIALPHPSGASPWHKIEPGKSMLARALRKVRKHPAMIEALGSKKS